MGNVKQREWRRLLALVLSMCMIFALLPATTVLADGNRTLEVKFQVTPEHGHVEYSNDGTNWTTVSADTANITVNDSFAVKIVPDGGYEVDPTALQYRVGSDSPIGASALLNALTGPSGLRIRTSDAEPDADLVVASGVAFALEGVEFRSSGGGGNNNGGNNNGGDYTIAFDGTVNGSVVSYTVNQTPVTVTVSGAAITGGAITVPANAMDSVTFKLSDNFDPDTMEVAVVADDGFSTTLAVEDGVTSLAKKTNDGGLPTSLHLVVDVKGNHNGGGGGEPGGGSTRPASSYTGETKRSTWTLDGEGDIFVNGVQLKTSEDDGEGHQTPLNSGEVEFNLDEDVETVDFEFTCFFNMRYTSIKINGEDYSDCLPQTQADLLDALDANGNSQITSVILPPIAYADSYEIEATWKVCDAEDAEYVPVGNFLWSYLDEDAGGDDYLDHGRLNFVSLTYGGNTYNSLEELKAEDKAYLEFGEFHNGQEGGATLPYGAELTVELIPEYGYQLVSFGPNGGTFETGEEVGVYTFTIARNNFHLGAHFEPVSDAVQATASQEIAGGSIQLGANEIGMGSAVLTIADTSTTAAENTAFANAASGYTVDSYLELNLNQVIYKGSRTDYWSNGLSSLSNDATISLTLSDTLSSSDVEIVHQKHDGTYEVIPATYNASSKTVTFKTDSFSKYAIAYKAAATQTQTQTQEEDHWVQNADGTWSYISNGEEATGWQEVNGTWYYLDEEGTMETGWVEVNGTWYYTDNSGAMQTGWQEVNGTWYYMDNSGAMETGWVSVNGTWYYTSGSGAMLTGWQLVSGKWYYLTASGAMQTGWLRNANNWYYLDASGAMKTGWYTTNGKWYYSYDSGALATNTRIGSYRVNADGEWVR
ncbi:MAG: N-acetylmuramoyl-L-alanine amidase family protein [Lachnospiraceae bacterium]|nr:N-acetylmuramoyl-L-alanine amidase family protein [Lachnospiraceae bacterium]